MSVVIESAAVSISAASSMPPSWTMTLKLSSRRVGMNHILAASLHASSISCPAAFTFDAAFFQTAAYSSLVTPLLNGTMTLVEANVVTCGGPAWGEILGLPEGDAGNVIAVTFATGALSGVARVTLDDNGWTTGGGRVFRNPGTPVDVGGQIVDCATVP